MTSLPQSDLCLLTAVEAIKLFRARRLSPVELLNAHLERAERLEPAINALSARRVEEALDQAVAAGRAYMSSPSSARPLEGVPTLLKNEHNLVGLHTTQGSWLCGDAPDTHNALLVERLLDAGAVIHGQTNVPEFYLAAFTRSQRYGVTRNPWNPAITCGGSSGGAGAALAAGMTILATASDIGGSIRVPSAYCGVVGLRPSYGRVPEGSFVYAMNPCNQNGVMARSVADCALMFNVIGGPHPADPATVKPKLTLPTEFEPAEGLRIAVSYDLGYYEIADDVRRNTRAVAETLRHLGARVSEVAIPWDASVRDTFTNYLGFLLGAPLVEAIRGHEERVSDYIRHFAELSQRITPQMFHLTVEAIAKMHASLQAVFENHDVLICPTLADTLTPAEGMAESHENLMNKSFTYPFNLLSRHPVLAVPSGLADNGVPTGVQIVGRTFDEVTVMRVGAAIEREQPWGYPRF